jgi:hypothetical protein
LIALCGAFNTLHSMMRWRADNADSEQTKTGGFHVEYYQTFCG